MSNLYIDQFLNLAKERFSVDSLSMTMSDWICKNTSLKKRPFSFKGYEFQEQIVNDMHPNMDVIKISQVGLTEVQIRKALGFLVRNRGTSLIFSLPDENMYERVSSTRVKPIVSADKVFNTPMDKAAKVTRSMGIMQFDQSFLYLVPASEESATSIPADAIFNDEVDLSDQKILSLFNSRMQNSKYKIAQRFSTPTFPAFGIDLSYQASDQHVYLCKCRSCGHWNEPQFDQKFMHIPGLPDIPLLEVTKEAYEHQLDFVNAYVKCERCHNPLDLSDPTARQWVPLYPSRVNARGYKISPFVTDRLSLEYIFTQMWKYQSSEFIRGFYNTVLGRPYSDGNIQIPLEDINACFTLHSGQITPEPHDNVWIGVDMGQTCHVIVGRGNDEDNLEIIQMHQINVREIVSWLKDFCEKYNVIGGCCDRHPYEPTARDIFVATNGKILPVEYRGLKDTNLVKDHEGNVTHAQANHTFFLDNFANKIRKHKIRISGYGNQKTVYSQHLREVVRNEEPGKPAHWVKLNSEDHYLHASGMMTISLKFQELIRFHSKEEPRTSLFTLTVDPRIMSSNLIGMGNKKMDTLGFSS